MASGKEPVKNGKLYDVEEQLVRKLKTLGYQVDRNVTLQGKFKTE